MNLYELIFLCDSALGEEKIGAVVAKVEEKIKGLGGEVEKVEKWGTKKLASIIKRAKGLAQGYYVLIRFRSAPSLPAELISFLRVTENIARYFISRGEICEVAPVEEKGIAGVPLEVGEIKSVEEEAELGKP